MWPAATNTDLAAEKRPLRSRSTSWPQAWRTSPRNWVLDARRAPRGDKICVSPDHSRLLSGRRWRAPIWMCRLRVRFGGAWPEGRPKSTLACCRSGNGLAVWAMSLPRYALYVTLPPEIPLAGFGASALGYECQGGSVVAQTVPSGLDPAAVAAATVAPSRYGFHATIVAPFRLAPRWTRGELISALRSL